MKRRGEYPKATERRQRIVRFTLENPLLSNAEVGEVLGISAHSVCWALRQEGASEARLEARRNAREWAELQERVDRGLLCVVCGCWVLRKAPMTCSPECADAWVAARLQLSPEHHHKHRIAQAKSILRYPEKHKAVEVDWARRMLSDDPPKPVRRWVRKDCRPAKVLEKVSA